MREAPGPQRSGAGRGALRTRTQLNNNESMQRSDIEIMAPVGSYEALAAAIDAGADGLTFSN